MSRVSKIFNYIPIWYYRVCFLIEDSVISSKEDLLSCLRFLKSSISYQYNLLSMISAVDFVGKKIRFCVCYELLSPLYSSRVRVKCFLNEEGGIMSIVSLFKSANWWEREIWDLFGLYFKNHPDLRRLLTDYGFEGHPMRKDFPLYGFIEYRYSEQKGMVIPVDVSFSQENRKFLTLNNW